MATTAQDLAQLKARHWAARPLPEPPRSRRVSALSRRAQDAIDLELEAWMSELTVGNTIDGE